MDAEKFTKGRYQIFVKGEQVSPNPNSYFATLEMAQSEIPALEARIPFYKSKLEVREAVAPK